MVQLHFDFAVNDRLNLDVHLSNEQSELLQDFFESLSYEQIKKVEEAFKRNSQTGVNMNFYPALAKEDGER